MQIYFHDSDSGEKNRALSGIESDAEYQGDQDPDPAGRKPGECDGGDAQLHGLRFRFHHTESDGNKVAGALAVDGKQGGERQRGGDRARQDQISRHCRKNLGGDSPGPEYGAETRDGTEDADQEEARQTSTHGFDELRQKFRETGPPAEADEKSGKAHKGEKHVQAGPDGIPRRLVKNTDNFADERNRFQNPAIQAAGRTAASENRRIFF